MTGKSKGYGFVRFTSETTAATARHQMHGQVHFPPENTWGTLAEDVMYISPNTVMNFACS